MLLALEFTVRSPIPTRDHALIPRNRKRRPGHPLRTRRAAAPGDLLRARLSAGGHMYCRRRACAGDRHSGGGRPERSLSHLGHLRRIDRQRAEHGAAGCAPGPHRSRIYPADGHVGRLYRPSAWRRSRKTAPALLATLVVVSSFFQFALARRLSLLRRIVTPTVAGTVIMLIASNRHAHHFRTLDRRARRRPSGRRPRLRRGDRRRAPRARAPRYAQLAAVGAADRHRRGVRRGRCVRHCRCHKRGPQPPGSAFPKAAGRVSTCASDRLSGR